MTSATIESGIDIAPAINIAPLLKIFTSELLFNYTSIYVLRSFFNYQTKHFVNYHKVASRRTPWVVAYPRIFRMFMKEQFDAYVL